MNTNAFVFLFPYTVYFELENWQDNHFQMVNHIIDTQFRKSGYDIIFVTYENTPVDSRITFEKTDVIISDGKRVWFDRSSYGGILALLDEKDDSSGFGLHEFDSIYVCNKLLSYRTYEAITLGGFHIGACIDDIAKELVRKGKTVSVCEETTDVLSKYI